MGYDKAISILKDGINEANETINYHRILIEESGVNDDRLVYASIQQINAELQRIESLEKTLETFKKWQEGK